MLHAILLNYVLPLVIYGAITGLANLLLSKKSQVELWAEKNPKLAAAMKLLRAIGLDPWQIISAISLWATSKLPDAQRSEGLKAADPKLPKPPSTPSGMGPMGGALALCLCFSLGGCAWLKNSFAPAAKHCEPSAAALVSQVEQILLSGGDYAKTLEQLAVQDGESVITCAVATAIELLAKKVGAEDGSADGVARGKAYLAKHPAQ